MPIVTVTKHGSTKSGKPVVYFDNRHTYKDMYFLNDDVEAPPVGAQIDADTKSSGDGRFWSLRAWGLTPNQTLVAKAPPHAPPPPVAPVNGLDPLPMAGVAPSAPPGLPIEPGDVMRFISNCVGQAINAKTIIDPVDILPWAIAALGTARKLRDGI